jgi:NAD(P)-dependent dehydrogenase (short-subunit alcohol dehydrogenase family)
MATFDLTGRVAVVTGACGILGRHFVAALAEAGASIAAIDLDRSALESLASELTDAYGVRAKGFVLDTSDSTAVGSVVDRIEAELGPVAILHNNAASKGPDLKRFFDAPRDFDPAIWREIMTVNVDGYYYMAREIGARMAARGVGSIVQTASIYGVVGPDQRIYEGSEYLGMPINTPAVYSASKAAVVGLTKYFATYWGDKGVRVNTLTPGGVSSGQNAVFDRKYSARVPLARMARAEEMATALLFLASDASSYVSGQNLVVDGGLTAW